MNAFVRRLWSVIACGMLLTVTAAVRAQTSPADVGGVQNIAAVAATRAGSFPRTTFFDELKFEELLRQNSISRWLFLLVAIAIAVALGRILTFILGRIANRLEKRAWHAQGQVFSSLAAPANLAIFTTALSVGLAQLVVPPLLADINKRVLLLLYAISIFWYAFNLVEVLEVALKRITARTETTLDDDLVPVVRKALRIFIVVIGGLFILQNVFERDIGAWLAGLGIAGLAVSLAAQDSLKNLFGSLTILFDRPFARGQRIKFNGFDGTVEDIGFRSTKIRTGDGTLVTIPNSNIVNDPVDNWQVRGSIRRVMNVTLTYDTSVAKVREAIGIIREILTAEQFRDSVHDTDAKANADPPRVYFDEFNAESLNIKIFYWFRPNKQWEFLEFNERFNLRLMEEFEKMGIEFAFPTRTIYLASDPKRKLRLESGPESSRLFPSHRNASDQPPTGM